MDQYMKAKKLKKLDLNHIYTGDCLDVLSSMPSESIDCCVTSPPYYGLRDYEVEPSIWGGDPECAHKWGKVVRKGTSGGKKSKKVQIKGKENFQIVAGHEQNYCAKCGAWRGALGLEPSPEMYIDHLCSIIMELHRVLKKTGTLWLNIGDSYAGSNIVGRTDIDEKFAFAKGSSLEGKTQSFDWGYLKPKNLCFIPTRVAIELQKRGWCVRNDIIWHRPNQMPAPVKDRCILSHEHFFLLSKSRKYYFDYKAIQEPYEDKANKTVEMKSKRDVWSINTVANPEGHFAMFPPDLIEPCILAGCPKDGVCLDIFCGAGTVPIVCNVLDRNWIGIERSPDNVQLIKDRLASKKYGLKTISKPIDGGLLSLDLSDIRVE